MKTVIIAFLILLYFPTLLTPKVITINDDNFESQLSSHTNSKLLLVFYSQNCPHCHDFLPQFTKFSQKYSKQADFGKINASEEQQLARKFKIKFVPALNLVIGEKYYEFGEAERSEENVKEFIENPEYFSDASDISSQDEILPILSSNALAKSKKEVLFLCK